jgi:hypothetical protein
MLLYFDGFSARALTATIITCLLTTTSAMILGKAPPAALGA